MIDEPIITNIVRVTVDYLRIEEGRCQGIRPQYNVECSYCGVRNEIRHEVGGNISKDLERVMQSHEACLSLQDRIDSQLHQLHEYKE